MFLLIFKYNWVNIRPKSGTVKTKKLHTLHNNIKRLIFKLCLMMLAYQIYSLDVIWVYYIDYFLWAEIYYYSTSKDGGSTVFFSMYVIKSWINNSWTDGSVLVLFLLKGQDLKIFCSGKNDMFIYHLTRFYFETLYPPFNFRYQTSRNFNMVLKGIA